MAEAASRIPSSSSRASPSGCRAARTARMRSRTSPSRSAPARSSAWSANPARASPSPPTPSWACCRASSPPAPARSRLQGDDVLAATPVALRDLRGTRMAMIFQEPMTALNPVMRVGDQIDEVLEIHTKLSERDRRKRVLEIMRAVHLPEPERLIDVYPHQLSGGQRQRIMIAAALVLDPALLIADEPTTALDVTTQAQILQLIRELQERRGTGVLFITHDFGVVAEIADRVVVMQQGRVVEKGTRDEILRRPQSAYTRMLIASVPSLKPPGARRQRRRHRARPWRSSSKTYGGGGCFGTRPRGAGGRERRHRRAARRDGRHRRRIGLGQVDGRALHRAADRADRRARSGSATSTWRTCRSGRLRPHRRTRADRVPGPLPLAQSAAHGRRLDHRRARSTSACRRPSAMTRARRADGAGRACPGCARPLSAPVLGRPAPAHLHRARARHGAGAADRRRAGVGARRLGAGAGAQAARRRAPALRSGGAVHHPRPARRRPDLRPHRRDAAGRGRRAGADGGGVRRAASTTTRARCSRPRPDATRSSARPPTRPKDRMPSACGAARTLSDGGVRP